MVQHVSIDKMFHIRFRSSSTFAFRYYFRYAVIIITCYLSERKEPNEKEIIKTTTEQKKVNLEMKYGV